MTRWRPPQHYVHPGVVVVVPARVAAWLVSRAELDRLRIEVRGADPEVDSVLVALAVAGVHWRTSVTGSKEAAEPEAGSCSRWMNTNDVADRLDITPRAVVLAIAERRLRGEKVNGRWRISREDLEHYRAARQAA